MKFASSSIRVLAGLALVVAALAAPRLADAASINFSISNITPIVAGPGNVTASDQTGFFDVLINETGGTNNLFAFQADILLNSGVSGVSFINATTGTTSATYVYSGNSGEDSNAGTPFFSSNEAANSDTPNTGSTALTTTLLGLMHVQYDVPAGTPVGSYAITFNQTSPDVDPFSDFINITSATSSTFVSPDSATGSAIVVTPAPEPSSIIMLVLGAVGMFGFRRMRARKA